MMWKGGTDALWRGRAVLAFYEGTDALHKKWGSLLGELEVGDISISVGY